MTAAPYLDRHTDLIPYRLGLFFAKVDIPAKGYDLCWQWRGAKDAKGYGLFRTSGAAVRAHRFAAAMFNGEPPPSTHACHTCDNPSCVNPRHLFWGTARENVADCITKGRRMVVRGGKHGNAKLSDADVREIRLRCANGEQQRSVARAFGVTQHTIWSINAKQTWGHVA